MYAFGQTFLFKRSTHGIVVGVDEIPETVRQAQHKQDGGIVPHRYTGVAFSSRPRVAREMKARSAIRVVGIRLLLRASRISAPSFLRAALTGPGNGNVLFMSLI